LIEKLTFIDDSLQHSYIIHSQHLIWHDCAYQMNFIWKELGG